MIVSFTAEDTIDQTVCLNGVSLDIGNYKGLSTDETGAAEWTIELFADMPIQLWAQKSGGASTGAFTISGFLLVPKV